MSELHNIWAYEAREMIRKKEKTKPKGSDRQQSPTRKKSLFCLCTHLNCSALQPQMVHEHWITLALDSK